MSTTDKNDCEQNEQKATSLFTTLLITKKKEREAKQTVANSAPKHVPDSDLVGDNIS